MKEVIHTDKAPAAIGPYSQAVKVGDLMFTSGQVPIDPETGAVVEGGIQEQARQSLNNIKPFSTPRAPTWAPWSRPPCSWRTSTTSPLSTPSMPSTSGTSPRPLLCAGGRSTKDGLFEIEAVAVK